MIKLATCEKITTFASIKVRFMLIKFSVENFSSFNDRQNFSLLPGKGVLKGEHKTKKLKGSLSLRHRYCLAQMPQENQILSKPSNLVKD